MSARCLKCGAQFGLARRTIGTLWWQKDFCNKQCADDYQKELQQTERVRQFLHWLHSPQRT